MNTTVRITEKIQDIIDKIDYRLLPHSNLIIGKSGSGKHSLVYGIASRFNLEVFDITDKINLDSLNELYLISELHICLINSDEITVKEQNILLKFIEEPRPNQFIYLLSSNENNLLETVKNRSIITRISEYSKEELKEFSDDSLLVNLFDTPGKIKKAQQFKIQELLDYQNKMIEFAGKANFSNFLSIRTKLKESFPGIENNLDIFCELFRYVLISRIKSENDTYIIELYRCLDYFEKQLNIPKINKDDLFTNFLIEFKRISNGY